jgi:hypothetical protein
VSFAGGVAGTSFSGLRKSEGTLGRSIVDGAFSLNLSRNSFTDSLALSVAIVRCDPATAKTRVACEEAPARPASRCAT